MTYTAKNTGVHAPRGRNYTQKYSQNDKVETYADIYFKDHPDALIDTDPPEIKLKKLEERLGSFDLEMNEKFQILIQEKSMIYILYGEKSIESLKIHARIGQLYNENHRPQSALRHLQTSLELQKEFNVDEETALFVAVEVAEAHLSLRSDNNNESQAHIKLAMEVLNPHRKAEVQSDELRYRWYLVNARTYTAVKQYEQSMKQYEMAQATLDIIEHHVNGSRMAKLYVEMSETAAKMDDILKTTEYTNNAYEIFMKLGMQGSASLIQSKVSKDKIREVEEKYGRLESEGMNWDAMDDIPML